MLHSRVRTYCGTRRAVPTRTNSCARQAVPTQTKSCARRAVSTRVPIINININNPLTARVIGAPKMILQPVFSIFPCSPLPSGTCRTPGLSIPWCCLPTSFFAHLVFFPLSLCLARWFWPDMMNGKHDHTTAVCVSLRSKTHKRLKERFLRRRNRTKRAYFRGNPLFQATIQQKTIKPTYLCPLDARKLAEGKGHETAWSSGDLHVVQLLAGSWHGLPRW